MSQATLVRVPSPPGLAQRDGVLVRIAIAFTAWAERWFPDAFVFVAIAVVVVALAAISTALRRWPSAKPLATASGA